MKDKKPSADCQKDFEDFLSTSEIAPPADISFSLTRKVKQDLNPTLPKIIAKLALVQMPVALLSLMVCSQFGIGQGDHLKHAIWHLGEFPCMMICGSLYLGMPILAAPFFLSRSDIVAIRRFIYMPILCLGLFSLLLFLSLGAEITFSLGFFWLLGGLLAGIFATEAGIKIPQFLSATRRE